MDVVEGSKVVSVKVSGEQLSTRDATSDQTNPPEPPCKELEDVRELGINPGSLALEGVFDVDEAIIHIYSTEIDASVFFRREAHLEGNFEAVVPESRAQDLDRRPVKEQICRRQKAQGHAAPARCRCGSNDPPSAASRRRGIDVDEEACRWQASPTGQPTAPRCGRSQGAQRLHTSPPAASRTGSPGGAPSRQRSGPRTQARQVPKGPGWHPSERPGKRQPQQQRPSTLEASMRELGLPLDASLEDVRKAYRMLARRYHPDKNPQLPKAEAEARFSRLATAYAVACQRHKDAA